MVLDRRALTGLAAAGLLLAAIAGAAVFLGVPRVQLSDEPTDADRVTLYQNGLAFIELRRDFASGGGQAQLVFAVPSTTIFDSLAVEGQGVEVHELRSALAAEPLLKPGDNVTVHIEGEAFRGILVRQEGTQLILAGPQGTTLVDTAKADAIEVAKDATQDAPGSAEVAALVTAPAGAREVRLSYLARGPGWTPTYRLDLPGGHLAFQATLTGLEDWANVSLDLVSGSPNVVSTPTVRDYFFEAGPAPAASPRAGLGADVAGFSPSTPLGDLHRYHLERNVTLARGETLRLPVLDGAVEVARHYYEAAGSTGFGGITGDRTTVTVRERAELRNTLPEPLPPGVARFYRNGTWTGEDLLPSTPVGARSNVTLAFSEDVQAHVVLERLQGSGDRDTYTYALTVENFKKEAIDLRATLPVPTFRTNVLRMEPLADEVQGALIVWNDPLPAGGKITYRVTYETLRNF